MERTWICREIELSSPRSVIQLARTTRELLLLTSRIMFRITWMCTNQQFYARWKDHIHVHVQRHWMDKEKQEQVLLTAKEMTAFCDPIHAKRLLLGGPRQKMRRGMQIPTNLKDNEILSHCTWLTYSSVILPTRYLQRQSHYRVDSWRKEEATSISKILWKARGHPKTISASNLHCTYNRICQWYEIEKSDTETENSGRRRANRSRTRAVDIDYAKNSKQWHKHEATRCYSQASEQAVSARTEEKKTIHQCIWHGPKQLYSFLQKKFRTKKFSKF